MMTMEVMEMHLKSFLRGRGSVALPCGTRGLPKKWCTASSAMVSPSVTVATSDESPLKEVFDSRSNEQELFKQKKDEVFCLLKQKEHGWKTSIENQIH